MSGTTIPFATSLNFVSALLAHLVTVRSLMHHGLSCTVSGTEYASSSIQGSAIHASSLWAMVIVKPWLVVSKASPDRVVCTCLYRRCSALVLCINITQWNGGFG